MTWLDFGAGAISGAIIAHILTPAELIKVRMQAGMYTSTWDCIRSSVSTEGVGVLFRGHAATLAREIPGTAVWLGTYETLVNLAASDGRLRSELSHVELIGAGAAAGVAYWAIPFPIDTVKTVMQAASPTAGTPPSMLQTAAAVYKAGGLRGFYRGLLPSLVRGAPGSAAILYTTELIQRMLDTALPPGGTTIGEWKGEDEGARQGAREAVGLTQALALAASAGGPGVDGWRGAR